MRVHWSWLRRPLRPLLPGLLNVLPGPLIRGLTEALRLVLVVLRRVPANPLWQACHRVSSFVEADVSIASAHAIYREYADQLKFAADWYARLLKSPTQRPPITMSAADADRLRGLVDGGGLLLVLPHNIGGGLALEFLGRKFPCRVLSRYAAKSNRAYAGIFQSTSFELGAPRCSQGIRQALAERQLVVGLADTISKRPPTLSVRVLGGWASIPAESFQVAGEVRAQVVPGYVSGMGDKLQLRLGKNLRSPDPSELAQHCFDYFESEILRDPASWAFLLDRRWRQHLRDSG